MYENFYGFSEGPFEFRPDPRFLYLTPSHAEALTSMLQGVRKGRGITVTGDPGIGKTTLIRALLAQLDEKVRTAYIVFTRLEFRDLLKSILHELGIPARGEDTFALLATFYLYLSERPQDEIVSIVIDEAQGLDTPVLEDLMKLWAGPNPRHSQLQMVLVGQPELEAKLDSLDLRSLREKIAVRRHIRGLTRQESNLYIDHRLRIAGSSSSKVFTPEGVNRICDCAGGIPRVINMVCDGSLFIGYAKSQPKIDAKIVNEAIEGLKLFEPKEAKGTPPEPLPAEESRPGESAPEPVPAQRLRWRPVYQMAAGSLLVTLALGLFILFISDRAPWRETNVKGIGTIIAEEGSTLSALPKQNQSLAPEPSASVKRERSQRLARNKRKGADPDTLLLAHNQRNSADPDTLLLAHNLRNSADPDTLMLKQDAAWHILQH